MIAEPTLAELAAASGLQPRTIRSWVAQDLLPAPLNRGPGARYPADMLQRLLAIRAMRDLLGMPLAAIRQELLVASAERIARLGSWEADPITGASHWSAELYRVLGIPAECDSQLGALLDAVLPSDRSTLRDALNRVANGQPNASLDVRLRAWHGAARRGAIAARRLQETLGSDSVTW